MSYTIKNLNEVEDSAAKHGYSELQEARFPREDLAAERTGLAYIVLRPGKKQPFAHRHDEAEEIYVVLSGSARVKVGDEIVELGALDAIRLPGTTPRGMEGGPEGAEILAFGAPNTDNQDAEMLMDFWPPEEES